MSIVRGILPCYKQLSAQARTVYECMQRNEYVRTDLITLLYIHNDLPSSGYSIAGWSLSICSSRTRYAMNIPIFERAAGSNNAYPKLVASARNRLCNVLSNRPAHLALTFGRNLRNTASWPICISCFLVQSWTLNLQSFVNWRHTNRSDYRLFPKMWAHGCISSKS